MPTHSFRCARGHQTDDLVSRWTRSIRCKCGLKAQRELSAPQLIVGRARAPQNERPLPFREYEEAAQETNYRWEKLENEVGKPIKRPDYFGMANRKAQDVLAGKTAPPQGWTDPV